MKHGYFAAAASASVIAVTLLGAGIASAHGWGFKRDPQEIADHHAAMFEEQAALLGVDVASVKDAWAQGKDLRALAEEKGISKDDLHARMKAAHQERMASELQALVDKGVITQAQADARKAAMETSGAKGPGFFHVNVEGGPSGHPDMMFFRR